MRKRWIGILLTLLLSLAFLPTVAYGEDGEADATTPAQTVSSENEGDTQDAPVEETEPSAVATGETEGETIVVKNEPLSIDVSYNPSDLRCGVPVTFTMQGKGGSGTYKYNVLSVATYVNGTQCYDAEFRNAQYSDNNVFQYTFMASGSYRIDFYVMDMGSTPMVYTRKMVTFTIRDGAYPSVEERVRQIVAECNSRNYATEYEKALFYHDWLILNSQYDYSLQNAGAGGVLCKGSGTCESYYSALTLLLNGSGIASERVVGGGHVWNRVKLDGEWTLIDATWDAGSSYDSFYSHLYFGVTDEMMARTHTGSPTSSTHPCTVMERNYFIRSGKITEFSDGVKQQMDERIAAGESSFTLTAPRATDPNVYKVLYPLAAYYLDTYAYRDAGVRVEYTMVESANYSYRDSYFAVTCDPCAQGHTEVTDSAVPASCETTGLTEGRHCSVCSAVLAAQSETVALGHDWAFAATDPVEPGKTIHTCSRCGATRARWQEGFTQEYTYAENEDPHKAHPDGMTVYFIASDGTKTELPELKDFLSYKGTAVRLSDPKGIRIITEMSASLRDRLAQNGVHGWKLVEYGTAVIMKSKYEETGLFELGAPGVANGFAFNADRGTDAVFSRDGDRLRYTNNLTGYRVDQCAQDLLLRSYAVFRNAEGRETVLYSGILNRSISYIAGQSYGRYAAGSPEYTYLKSLADLAG